MSHAEPDDRGIRSASDPQEASNIGTQVAADSAPAAGAVAYLLSGPITFGGIGLALDAWLNTSFLIVIGLLFGMGVAFYIIWIRYGKA